MSGPDLTEELNGLDAMMWRVLRNTTLRALVKASGRTPLDVSVAEADKLLEPFQQALIHDCAVMREAFRRMYTLGVEAVSRELHGQPGVDDEALDDALIFHSQPRDDDGEALKG
jgi:hypothetical protein